MEPDSTTSENNSKDILDEHCFPFTVSSNSRKLYSELIYENGERCSHKQIIDKLKEIGLIPKNVKCSMAKPDCNVICKSARVIDRVQWVCEQCGARQSIRTGSFFMRLQCSIVQALQMILAWCEDADLVVAAEHFGVKSKVAQSIYDKLDELAVKQCTKTKLGGDDSVVLVEMYPDCLNRLSPDTTDNPHVHRILMMADTKHIATHYWLHVMKDNIKKGSCLNEQLLKSEIENVVRSVILPNSNIVAGCNVPMVDGAIPMQQLLQRCNGDMQHFLTSRIWQQALSLCAAARDLCTGVGRRAEGPGTAGDTVGVPGAPGVVPGGLCALAIQRYLTTALYRIRHTDHFFMTVLEVIADELTAKYAD